MRPLEKIVQTLMVNGTLTDQPGLFYGKTGIAIFFFNYARQTDNELFRDYAIDLIEEIQKQVTVTYSARYDVGLAGIGAGFEYFLQNGFLEADDSNIFEDFDARMYRAAMYEPYPDLNLEGGLTGWGRYFIDRLRSDGHKHSKLHEALTHIANEIAQKILENTVPENEQPDVYRFFYDLTSLPGYNKYSDILQKCRSWDYLRKTNMKHFFSYMSNLPRLYACYNYFNFKTSVVEEIDWEWEKWKKSENQLLTDIGLLKGWTNEGLLYLANTYETDCSWMNLL